jgi:hypothetical protein
VGVLASLASGNAERARRDLQIFLAQWQGSGFHLPHWQAAVYDADIDLYSGDAGRAYERFTQCMPDLNDSRLLRSGYVRAITWFTRGKLALASVSGPEALAARTAEARRMVQRLDREHERWAEAVARLLEASIERATGNAGAAVAKLRIAVERLEAADTILLAVPARYRLGEWLGNQEGRKLVRTASEALSAQGVREPERWTNIFIPRGAPSRPLQGS